MNIRHNLPLRSHVSMLMAEVFWGLMAPLGKDAMSHGIDGITMVSLLCVSNGRKYLFATSFFLVQQASLDLRLISVCILSD